jgi:uncharacterized membrane protein YfcA
MALADISLAQAALVAVVALAASVLGGLAGYGTGLVLPVVLAPVIGVANVVPVMALAMMINNASRVAAFRHDVQWPHVRRILWLALPLNVAAAWFYTRLEARTIALLLGLFLLASLPLRAWLRRRGRTLGPRGEALAGGAFGLVNGTLSGTGVILISTLMAAGVQGPALIATDAVISVVLELAKVAVFGGLARLDAPLALAGLLVGLCTAPGAFAARRLLDVIPPAVHARVMEAVVVVGACGFLWRALA